MFRGGLNLETATSTRWPLKASPHKDEPCNTPQPTYARVANSTSSCLARPQTSQPFVNNWPDKNFNVVVYGINEYPEGSFRHTRIIKYTENVSTVLQKLDPSISNNSIHDCVRLGKYKKRNHRPILVKLSRSREVTSILANRKKLAESPGVSIKPDMSKEERLAESAVLKARWELINSGTERVNKIFKK